MALRAVTRPLTVEDPAESGNRTVYDERTLTAIRYRWDADTPETLTFRSLKEIRGHRRDLVDTYEMQRRGEEYGY